MLSILSRIVKNNENVVIPLTIKKFHKNYRLIKRQKQILNKILHCKAGKVPLSFMLWKSLPNPGSKILKQKAMKFENGLRMFYSRNLKMSF